MKKIITLMFTSIILIFSSISDAHDKKIIVILDWFANPNHAPLFVAKQEGFFAANGLDVDFIGPADPADPPKLVAAGKADIAITYEPQFMEQVENGLPLIRIGTLIDHPLNCLVVLKNSSIHSIQDLKGKRIGYSLGMIDIALDAMLKNNELNVSDVEKINVHYDLTQALLSKKVDAVIGMMRTFEVIQMELVGSPVLAFLPEKNGVPNYSELILVVNKNNQQDPRYKKFMLALQQGVIYLQQHPEESWNKFAKLHPELNDKLNHKAWIASLPYFAKNPLIYNKNEWQKFQQFMLKNGLIKTTRSVNEYAIELN